MKSSQQLRRLAEQKAMNLKVELNAIEQQLNECSLTKQNIESQILFETRLAQENPALALHLDAFLKGARAQIALLDAKILEFQKQHNTLQEKIRNEFADMKTMDIYRKRQDDAHKRAKNQREQKTVDELAINKIGREY